MEKQIEYVNHYELSVRGVWGRNRTEKFEVQRLTSAPRDAAQPEERALTAMVEVALNGMKLKTGCWQLIRRNVEVERYDGGVKIERFALFTDQTTLATGSR